MCIAELGLLGPHRHQLHVFLLHLLQLRHLNKNFMDFVLRKALENIGALGLVQLFLSDSILLKILKVPDTVGSIIYIVFKCISHA